MQLLLFGTFPFPAGSWAREARVGSAIVVWISNPVEAVSAGLAGRLRMAGVVLAGAAREAGGLAVLIHCPPLVRSAILQQLPQPKNQGSKTAGNYLDW